ncbi:hypothetical protein TNCV_784281 [Trichonephila clavipes]|nr:hypothetical protein TNCV_784281 [Trichonephila clavipes]
MFNRCPSRARQLSSASSLRVSEPLALETEQRIRNDFRFRGGQRSGSEITPRDDFSDLCGVEILSTLRVGNTRPLPGHSSIGYINIRKKLHPGVPPRTTESNKGGSVPVIWQNQARRLPGVHPEHSATTTGQGSNGSVVWTGKEGKEKCDDTRKKVENREKSLGYPGVVTPEFTKDSINIIRLNQFITGHFELVSHFKPCVYRYPNVKRHATQSCMFLLILYIK